MGGGQYLGVLLGLIAGAAWLDPSPRLREWPPAAARYVEEQRGSWGFAPMLRLKYEAASLVKVYEASAGKARQVSRDHRALKNVLVLSAVSNDGLGRGTSK